MTILSMYTEAAWTDEALPEISHTYLATHTRDLSQSLKLGLNFIRAVTYVSTCAQHDAVQEIDKADLEFLEFSSYCKSHSFIWKISGTRFSSDHVINGQLILDRHYQHLNSYATVIQVVPNPPSFPIQFTLVLHWICACLGFLLHVQNLYNVPGLSLDSRN